MIGLKGMTFDTSEVFIKIVINKITVIMKFLVARKTIGNDTPSVLCNLRSISTLGEYYRVSYDCCNIGFFHSFLLVLSRFCPVCIIFAQVI